MITIKSATRGSDDGSEPRFDFGASAVRGASPGRTTRAEAGLRKVVAEGKAKPGDIERGLIEMRKAIVPERKSNHRE